MVSNLTASAANLRMPSDSFSTAMRSSLCCQRKAFSSRWIFSRSQALAATFKRKTGHFTKEISAGSNKKNDSEKYREILFGNTSSLFQQLSITTTRPPETSPVVEVPSLVSQLLLDGSKWTLLWTEPRMRSWYERLLGFYMCSCESSSIQVFQKILIYCLCDSRFKRPVPMKSLCKPAYVRVSGFHIQSSCVFIPLHKF